LCLHAPAAAVAQDAPPPAPDAEPEPGPPAEPADPCAGQPPDAPIDFDKPRTELTACELSRIDGPCKGVPVTAIDRDQPLAAMDPCALWRLGFQWEGYKAHDPSVVAGLVAAVPGLVFNGLGHFYQGNRWVGWRLLGTEGVGLGLIAAGILTVAAVDESSAFDDVGIFGINLGGVLISSAYVMDVIGSSKATKDTLPAPTGLLDTTRPRLAFQTLLSDEFDCTLAHPCHFLELALDADLGFFVLGLHTLQHVLRDYAEYTAELGLKLRQGREESDYLAWFFTLENASFDRKNFTVLPSVTEQTAILRFETTARLSLNLGQILESLDNVVDVVSMGIGFAGDAGYRAAVPGKRTRGYLIVEQQFLINVHPDVMIRPHYIYSESELVGPIARTIGAFGADVLWTPWRGLGLEAGVLVGSGELFSLNATWDF